MVADALIYEMRRRIERLPDAYRAMFDDVSDVEAAQVEFVAQVKAMDAAQINESGLMFSAEEIKLLRERG